jgi:hypothetical protein
MKRNKYAAELLITSALAGFAILFAANAKAQYFQSQPNHKQHTVVKASGYDSVIVDRSTPFDLPKTNDTLPFIYLEPMPDSIIPRSAIVIGTITLQFEDIEDVVPALEKYARESKLSNYAAVSGWFNTYCKHLGFKGDDNTDEDNK